MGDFEIKVDTTKLDALVRKMGFRVGDLIEKAARDTAAGAATNTSRVDTGLMKNSWDARQEDNMTWIVGDFGCGYAWFHEHGFHHHVSGAWIAPTPMLYPSFTVQWNTMLSSLSRAGVLL